MFVERLIASMAKNRIDTSNPDTIKRLMKEGRGFGDYENYISWLHVQDVPSLGRSHRMQGWRTGNRVVHLLSYLEVQHFYNLEWDRRVDDYHEQFPLDKEVTERLAKNMGIPHPRIHGRRRNANGEWTVVRATNVMTTDILVFYKVGDRTWREAHSVKPLAKLEGKGNERTKEKLRLEQAYWEGLNEEWEGLNVKWRLVTDAPVGPEHGFSPDALIVIDRVLVSNMEWIHDCFHLDGFASLTKADVVRVHDALWTQVREGREALTDLAIRCDESLKLPEGASLTIAKHLMARRVWPVDFTKPFHPCHPLALNLN